MFGHLNMKEKEVEAGSAEDADCHAKVIAVLRVVGIASGSESSPMKCRIFCPHVAPYHDMDSTDSSSAPVKL